MFDPSVGLDLDQLRDRLKRFSDQELVRFGKASRYMCAPAAQPFGGKHPPDPVFVVQLKEAREEWARRKKPTTHRIPSEGNRHVYKPGTGRKF